MSKVYKVYFKEGGYLIVEGRDIVDVTVSVAKTQACEIVKVEDVEYEDVTTKAIRGLRSLIDERTAELQAAELQKRPRLNIDEMY